MSKDELLQKITALDFFAIDLHLYLNTHPDDKEAVALYNDYIMQLRKLRQQYNEQYGMLLSGLCTSAEPWQWIDNPWPWEKKFNAGLKGGTD